MANHPAVTPPVKAPSTPLPVTTLPNGLMKVPAISATAGVPTTIEAEQPNFFSSISNSTIFYSLIGIGVFVLIGMIWFFRESETPAGGETP